MKTVELFERVGDDVVFGMKRSRQRLTIVASMALVVFAAWDFVHRGELEWSFVIVALFLLVEAVVQMWAAKKASAQLVVGPTELTWNGGDPYNKTSTDPVRAPRSALTRVWLHGPARESARRRKMSQWQVSAVLEGEGLPVDVTAALASSHEEAARIGRELAADLAVPFEDRTV